MKVGDIVKGKVVNIKNYGVFVELENGTLALCHISEISKKYINNIFKLFNLDQVVYAKIIEINEEKHFVNLTIKGITKEERKKFEIDNVDFSKLENNINLWVKKYKKGDNNMKLNLNYVLNRANYKKYEESVKNVNQMINEKTGAGNDSCKFFFVIISWPCCPT